jgi:uncharacterized protein (TIGR03545 family)
MSKEKKPKKVKIPGLFAKKYDPKKFQKKILKKLFVPADKAFVESLFTTVEDPKKGTLHAIDSAKVTDRKTAKRLAIIAKQIKKQKGRFSVVSILLALAVVVALMLALTVFRNAIARVAVTSALEGTFGAKADIAKIDCDLLRAKFEIDGLAVANREHPMKNLFGIERFDMSFNLLELTRGKVVADNLEVTGITWNTDRKTSGALPPKKAKKYEQKKKDSKPNPVVAAIKAEADKVKSGVSVGAGVSAVMDQLDPVKYVENEKAKLQSPAVVEKITATVPPLADKWQTKNKEVRGRVDKALSDGKRLANLNVQSINTVEEARAALADLKAATDGVKATVDYAKLTADEAAADAKTVKALSAEAETAFKADSARLKALVDTVKGFNLDTGKTVVSDVFRTFVVNTLGAYYPYLDKGVVMLRELQANSKGEKKVSLKKKSNAISRLPGRTLSFGDDSAPSLLLKNIALSAKDDSIGIAGGAVVQTVTNDADRVNKPMTVGLEVAHGSMKETADGIIDLRSKATDTLDAKFTSTGYALAIDSPGVTGVPSVKGNLGAAGTIRISRDGTVTIGSKLVIGDAKLAVDAFKPEYLYGAYRNVLASIKTVDLDVLATVDPEGKLSVEVTTDVDDEIASAIKAEMNAQIEKVKAGIRKEADRYIAEQKAKYASEIARFGDAATKAQRALDDIKNYQSKLDAKKAEAEKRIKDLAAKKAAEKIAPVADTVKKAAPKNLKGLVP